MCVSVRECECVRDGRQGRKSSVRRVCVRMATAAMVLARVGPGSFLRRRRRATAAVAAEAGRYAPRPSERGAHALSPVAATATAPDARQPLLITMS